MIIRMASLDDAERLVEIYRPYVLEYPISFEEECPSVQKMATRIEKLMSRFPWLVAVVEDEIVGYAYGSPHRDRACYRWSVDVSVYIDRNRLGRGKGKVLYGRLLEILKEQGFVNAYAGIALPNEASVGLHEGFGFRPVGVYEKVGFKLGEWRDVGWWVLRLNHPKIPMPEPLAMMEVLLG